jgi:hypothetical protein
VSGLSTDLRDSLAAVAVVFAAELYDAGTDDKA